MSIGLIVMASNSIPIGFLECNGASLSTTTYANLFSVIGYSYGGSGSTFNLPDFRGMFLRGWSHGSTADPDRASRTNRGDGTSGDNIGTLQTDINKAHYHSAPNSDPFILIKVTGGNYRHWSYWPGAGHPTTNSWNYSRYTNSSGGNEARPKNINTKYCVKY